MRLRSTESGHGVSEPGAGSIVVGIRDGIERRLLPEHAALVRKLQDETGDSFASCAIELGYLTETTSLSESDFPPSIAIDHVNPALVMFTNPDDPVAIAARELRSTLTNIRKKDGAPVKSVALVHLGSQAEAAVLLANCAIACAMSGFKTLLVDGDIVSPVLHSIFDVDSARGVWDLVRKDSSLSPIQSTFVPALDFLPCGARQDSTPDMFEHSALALACEKFSDRYDFILTNAGSADHQGLSAARGFDAVLVSVRRNVTPFAQVRRVFDKLHSSKDHPAGAIFFD